MVNKRLHLLSYAWWSLLLAMVTTLARISKHPRRAIVDVAAVAALLVGAAVAPLHSTPPPIPAATTATNSSRVLIAIPIPLSQHPAQTMAIPLAQKDVATKML